MPGKSKAKGGKKNKSKKKVTDEKKELVLIDKEDPDSQVYAKVVKVLGGLRFEGLCFDKERKTRLLHVRGKLRKRYWINQGDFVLVSLRSYQDDRADVIHTYQADEARQLKKLGELPADAVVGDVEEKKDGGGDDDGKIDDVLVFTDVSTAGAAKGGAAASGGAAKGGSGKGAAKAAAPAGPSKTAILSAAAAGDDDGDMELDML